MPRKLPSHNPKSKAKAHTTGEERPDYHRWYSLRKWRKELRPATLKRDLWTCQRCERNYGHKPWKLVADHKQPHKGIWRLFIDMSNLWTLCKPCHDSWKKQQENKIG